MSILPIPWLVTYITKFSALTYCTTHFSWVVYGFNLGHFTSTISKRNLPFRVILAWDPYNYGHALFSEFVQCPTVLPSDASLLDHIRGLDEQGPIDGYLIYSHHYKTSDPTSVYLAIQASIVLQLWSIWRLKLFVAFVHRDHDGCSISEFVSQLKSSGWVISTMKCLFPDFVDSIIGTASIIVGVHDSTQSRVKPVLFWTPPSPRPLPLAAFIWKPFNKHKYAISLLMNGESFAANVSNGVIATPLPRCWHLSRSNQNLCIIFMSRIQIMHPSLERPFSLSTVFLHLSMVCQIVICSVVVLVSNFMQMITIMYTPSHHLN